MESLAAIGCPIDENKKQPSCNRKNIFRMEDIIEEVILPEMQSYQLLYKSRQHIGTHSDKNNWWIREGFIWKKKLWIFTTEGGGIIQKFWHFHNFFFACSNSSKSAIEFFCKGGRGTPWPNYLHFLNLFLFFFTCPNSCKYAKKKNFIGGVGVSSIDHWNFENPHNFEQVYDIFLSFSMF